MSVAILAQVWLNWTFVLRQTPGVRLADPPWGMHCFHQSPSWQVPSSEQQQLYKSKVSEALALAKEALVSFRQAGESKKKVSALKLAVDANMAMDKNFDAMTAASAELAMIKGTSDKQAEDDVSEMLAEVQISRGETGSACQTLNEPRCS